MSPSWLGGRGRERPSSPSCSPGHGGYVPDDAQGGKRCTGGASAASRLPTPSRLPAPAPPSVRQVGRAWPVLQGGRVGGAWPGLQGSRCSRAAGSGGPGRGSRAAGGSTLRGEAGCTSARPGCRDHAPGGGGRSEGPTPTSCRPGAPRAPVRVGEATAERTQASFLPVYLLFFSFDNYERAFKKFVGEMH